MAANKGCITRLSRYRNAVMRLKSLNFVRVFSDNLADAAGVTASQVRKDFSIFGITGNRRGGYKIDELVNQLNSILGKDELQRFIVVGVGNIGRALIQYKAFEKSGIKIAAGFDIDPDKYGSINDIEVMSLDRMSGYVRKNEIRMGIIAVPDFAAQQVFEVMQSAGIKGFLNVAPIRLQGSNGVVVNNLNLEAELENLIYFVNTADKTGKAMKGSG